MSDMRTPNSSKNKDLSLGFSGTGCLRFPIGTSISETGSADETSYCLGLSLEFAESLDEYYPISVDHITANTQGKLFPTGGTDGTTTENKATSLLLGFGRVRRFAQSLAPNGSLMGSLSSGIIPQIGRGQMAIARPDVSLGDSTYSFPGTDDSSWNIGTNYTLMGKVRPGAGRLELSAGPAFSYNVQYAGENSEFNRMRLEFMLMLSLGYGDAATAKGDEIDIDLGTVGMIQGFYAAAHKVLQRHLMDEVLSNPQSNLSEYFPSEEGNIDRGSQANVPFMQGASSMLGGLDGSLSTALRSGPSGFWVLSLIGLAGGAISLSSSSEAGRAGGLTDILKFTRNAGFALADIESSDKRLKIDDQKVRIKERNINLSSWGLGALLMLLGASAESNVMTQSAVAANMNISLSPDPLERGLVRRSDMEFALSNKGRAGIIVHKSLGEENSVGMCTSVMFLSPSMLPGNVANHATQDDPYSNIEQPSDIDAAMGLEWRNRFIRASVEADVKVIYGGLEDEKAGAGLAAGAALTLPITEKGSGVILGVRGTVHKILPRGETRTEGMATIGIEVNL